MIFNSINEKFYFYNIPVFLFSLLPFFLITGPFLSDLSVSLISLLFIIYCIKKKNFFYFKNRYFIFFFIFCCYLILNSLIKNFNFDSLKISFFYFRYGVFVIAVSVLLSVDNKFVKYFFYCIFICFLVLVLDGFYQYFLGKNILGWNIEYSRISSFFGDEKILGSYLSRLWPIFFGLSIFFLKRKNYLFFIFIIIFILSEALVFLSGDRSAFFYINLSAIFIILFSQKLYKLRLITLLSSALLIIIISFINPLAKERVFNQTINQMNLNYKIDSNQSQNQANDKIDLNKSQHQVQEKIYIFSKHHHEIYLSAYKMFLDNKLLGVGVKNYRNICKDSRYYVGGKEICSTHPHNNYLQILTEIGIVGFLFLLVVIIYFIKKIFKHFILKFKNQYYFTDFEICVISAILIYLWPIIPTGNVFNNWLNIIFILNIPFLIWSKKLI